MNVPWADISSSAQITSNTKKKYKVYQGRYLGGGSPDDGSRSEESNSDGDNRGMFKRLLPILTSLLTCLSTVPEKEDIEDHTETNLVNLRRLIYLTIMDALNYEEAGHKLLKVQLKEGEEV
jgi:pre-mRNA-splicing factor CWC22